MFWRSLTWRIPCRTPFSHWHGGEGDQNDPPARAGGLIQETWDGVVQDIIRRSSNRNKNKKKE